MLLSNNCFVFDLIGTLFDAKSIYVRAFCQAAKVHGLKVNKAKELEIYESIGDLRLSEIVARIFPSNDNLNFSIFQRDCNSIRDSMLYTDCLPFPNAIEAVKFVKGMGAEVFLLTATSEGGMDSLITKYSLENLFTKIFYRDLVSQSNIPNENLKMNFVSEIIEAYPDYFITIVGDSRSDFFAAKYFWPVAGFIEICHNDDATPFFKGDKGQNIFQNFAEFINFFKNVERVSEHKNDCRM